MIARLVRLAFVSGAVLLLSSCSFVVDDGQISFVDPEAQLLCEEFGTVILAAQSVPSSSHVPCIDAMPSGWRLERTEYNSDGTVVEFESGRAPIDDLRLEFTESCESAATRLPEVNVLPDSPVDATITSEPIPWTPVPGIRLAVEGDGYCAEFTVDFEAEEAIVVDDFPSFRWIQRTEIDRWIVEGTDMRLRLDP